MAGEEILIADGSARDRNGLAALAEKHGLVPSTVDNAQLARERVGGKFFAVLVVDLDLPGGGVDVLQFARERSPATQLVAMTTRKNYEGAVEAFRLGCVDVVYKRPEEVARIERSFDVAMSRYNAGKGDAFRGVTDALEVLIKTVVAFGRQVYASEIESLTEAAHTNLRVLFVDEDTRFLKDLSAGVEDLAMDAFVEMSGGGALDKLGVHSFDIVVTKEWLSDLPGQIVVNAAQQRNQECIALVYSQPGGQIDRVVDGKVVESYQPFADAKDVAERLRQLVDEENTRRRERKVLQVIWAVVAALIIFSMVLFFAPGLPEFIFGLFS